MSYPAVVDVETPPSIARWRPLVQWILALPHLIIASAMNELSGVIAFISWLVILFTGKLPAGLAQLQVMFLRYQLRVQAYATFLHDEYPPFAFSTSDSDPGDTPVIGSYVPALENRNRLTVGLRIIWLIPALFWLIIISFVGAIAAFLAFFAVLFTGRWPEGLRTWVVKSIRVGNRFMMYALMLTDEYPPFETEPVVPVSDGSA